MIVAGEQAKVIFGNEFWNGITALFSKSTSGDGNRHYFFLRGFKYLAEVIIERTGKDPHDYLLELIRFIESHVTQTTINEDLNSLLPPNKFQQIRKILFPETISFLKNELKK